MTELVSSVIQALEQRDQAGLDAALLRLSLAVGEEAASVVASECLRELPHSTRVWWLSACDRPHDPWAMLGQAIAAVGRLSR